MNHLELWKLATDVLLLLALVYLCFQFARSPRISAATRQLRELDAALRALIREADGAGRTLNEQLLHRQQSLEKILIDAQLTEERISQASSPSRENYQYFQRNEPQREELEGPRIERGRKTASNRAASEKTSTLEPASFPTPNPSRVDFQATDEEESTITFGETNIYGEPIERNDAPLPPAEPVIGKARRRAMETYSPLSAKIEKQVQSAAKPPKAKSQRTELEDVYSSAEKLLRAGSDLMAVASRTKLPIEEVRALSQMIIGERAVVETQSAVEAESDADPRLGVMAKMKRQTITL